MTRYPPYMRLGGPQDRFGRVWKISPPTGFDHRTVQPVASRYTDCANPAPDSQTGRTLSPDEDCRDDTHIMLKTFSTGRHLLSVQFLTRIESNVRVCAALTRHVTTKNYISYSKNSVAITRQDCTSARCFFNWNTSVTGFKRLTVWLPPRNHNQGQSHPPQ